MHNTLCYRDCEVSASSMIVILSLRGVSQMAHILGTNFSRSFMRVGLIIAKVDSQLKRTEKTYSV